MTNEPELGLDVGNRSNEHLGRELERVWLAYHASSKSTDLTDDVATAIKIATEGMDGDEGRHAALEKALRRAAVGEYEAAGRILREHLTQGARKLILSAAAETALQRIDELTPLAAKGAQFASKGRGAGPMRKLIQRVLKKLPANASARVVWAACKSSTAAKKMRIEFTETDAFVPNHGNIGFARFSTVLSELRNPKK